MSNPVLSLLLLLFLRGERRERGKSMKLGGRGSGEDLEGVRGEEKT